MVAHPDDEMLWCGGYILAHPEFQWRIVTLCRASDADRAPKFRRVLEQLGAVGEMADLDDGASQTALPREAVEDTVECLLAGVHYELILTHGPHGEYTAHRRHEECSRAVAELWATGRAFTNRLWCFAYEDGGAAYTPRVRQDANRRALLPDSIWAEKYRLITEVYGFAADSWEARTTPHEEGFWCFDSAQAAARRTRTKTHL